MRERDTLPASGRIASQWERTMRVNRRIQLCVFVAALIAAGSIPVSAEDYPARPITLIVPYPAGGGVDNMARVVAQKLGPLLGQQIIIENRPGAGAVIGTRAAAKAVPDGYTLVMFTTGISLPANTGYDLKDFAPVGTIASTPIVLMTGVDSPLKTLADVIAVAKKEPGKLNIGTPSPPTLNYFAGELLKVLTGADITLVTYKGTGPLTNDLVGGHVALGLNTIAPALGNLQAGKLRAIAVASPKRAAALPDVPTGAEGGLPGFEAVLYYGLAAPASTPPAIIERLSKELRAAVSSDEVSKRIVSDGGDVAISTPEQYAESLARDEAKWAALVKKLGIEIGGQ
jgi:tripartite-type tricarboxylate transporter receptor subunit TctC